ncbi:MAG: type II secretion system protein [Candidatus Yonathbacteria bacterium]|nr:type II secretion system protein [Candidatus Yonathbacteria bacterium]
MHNIFSKNSRGFTLIEMTVSLGLFTIIIFVATSAFLSVVNTDRKSRAVRVATDNLNIALEDMSRRIKTGSTYYCGSVDTLGVGDCSSGGDTLFFTGQDTLRTNYTLVNNAIWRTIGSDPSVQVTSPEVNITGLRFIVSGSALFSSGNTEQPKVVVAIDGSLGVGTASSTLKIETLITQRAYDN